MNMNELIEKVEEWARVRRLHTADPKAQALKVVEEFTEMVLAFDDFRTNGEDDASYEFDEVVDGIGDTYVTLIILCQQLDIDFNWFEQLSQQTNALKSEIIINQLATGVSKGRKEVVISSVVNALCAAKNIAYYIDIEPHECLQVAYNEIKDRKGMMIDGTFIKYDDLSDEDKAVLDNA